MEQLQRVQVLLERTQRRALTKIAKREKRSVSQILREIVDKGLQQRIRQERQWKEALGRLKQARAANRYRRYQGNLVARSRTERERQVETIWRKLS